MKYAMELCNIPDLNSSYKLSIFKLIFNSLYLR